MSTCTLAQTRTDQAAHGVRADCNGEWRWCSMLSK